MRVLTVVERYVFGGGGDIIHDICHCLEQVIVNSPGRPGELSAKSVLPGCCVQSSDILTFCVGGAITL